MKHYGDITQINGNDVPVVDCVIGGSPCQDLSQAGLRKGLSGERSGLYMEQIRIIKEMRQADAERGNTDVDIRPRYMVWENVPGAFSTNGGKDFAAVLEEAIRVADPEVPPVHVPEKGWPLSGCLWDEMGKWSVAWRVLDAQFWGTSSKPLPQRRRRIALVADFGGLSASQILFVSKSVSGNTEPGEKPRKATASDVGESPDGTGESTVFGISPYDSNAMKSGNPHSGIYEAETSRCLDAINCGYPGCNQGGMAVVQPMSIENHAQDSRVKINESGTVQTLTSRMGTGGGNVPLVVEPVGFEMQAFGLYKDSGLASTVKARDYKDATDLIAEPICINERQYALTCTEGMANTLTGTDYKGVQLVAIPEDQIHYIVRRLTPLECERLQGYPDGWTDIGEWVDSNGKKRKESDAPRYKALGNSIALPPWKWVLKRLCACYERDATMASLFDGIGGFPLIWEQLNGKGSCLWASEIEEFPIAVTKLRFSEVSNENTAHHIQTSL